MSVARNIEIKARIESIDGLSPKVRAIADQGPEEILQDDTFFVCANGRLKLRQFKDGSGELIFYQRPNQTGPKQSTYFRSRTNSPSTLRDTLTLAYGQCGRVRKRRTLYFVGRTRIHLDRVEGLGEFLELEVVLDNDEPAERGIEVARELLLSLGIQDRQLVATAYVDLLNDSAKTLK